MLPTAVLKVSNVDCMIAANDHTMIQAVTFQARGERSKYPVLQVLEALCKAVPPPPLWSHLLSLVATNDSEG